MKADKVFPVYRINHRPANLDFFENVLGMKVWLEEGTLVELGGHGLRERRIVLEESPAVDGFSAAGRIKKHRRTVLLANQAECERLYQKNQATVAPVKFDGNSGFSAISPEGDEFWLIGSEKFDGLQNGGNSDNSSRGAALGLSDFKVVELTLNVASREQANQDFAVLEAGDWLPDFALKFQENAPEKLAEVWDIESIGLKMTETTDFKRLVDKFSVYTPFLDAKARVLTVSLPEGIELWFEK